jgi:hypothetical protein
MEAVACHFMRHEGTIRSIANTHFTVTANLVLAFSGPERR